MKVSVLSFKAYCIETYAEHKNESSSAVFEQFEQSRLLAHLESDYGDLHGMGKEYLMGYFEDWLAAGEARRE